MSTSARPLRDRRGRAYTPAIGPGLKPLLWTVMGGFALLGANGVYLATVRALGWMRGDSQATPFYFLMFIAHILLGLILVVPFVIFGFGHLATSWKRPNKTAVRLGLSLLAASLVLLVSGLLLVQIVGFFDIREPTVRAISYWLHVGTPVLAIVLYIRHRMAGPRIHWEWARMWVGTVAVFVALMAALHTRDPLAFSVRGPKEGLRYFFPSEARTVSGNFVPAKSLMMDSYCLKCHQDAYKGWFHSSHHFSSFNNKAYLFSVRETRKASIERDGDTRAARWCAGCHDPVPFFSGEFDDPKYDDVNTASSQAGITCTACHAITHVDSTRGNAAYTIAEPKHYPFAYSENKFLQWVNQTLVKAKPEMHKATFLKPLHRDSKFCSTCHKVGLPFALNHYKDFVRGQNHWDTFWLSGVSGHGARSFYYPPPDQKAKGQCAECHMPLTASRDFGARDFDGKGGREIHDHFFPGANTGLASIRGDAEVAKRHEAFLKDKKVRIDIFGLRDGTGIDDALIAPLRPKVPELKPNGKYLVETVVRTLGLGHPLTQGTVDSNEIWVELIARVEGKIIGRSGGIGGDGQVDPYSHFINVYMLDRSGKRIDRRNPQDIFVPLYNKQIPPGAGQVVHFALEVPKGVSGPIELEAKVNYRKFDRTYMDYVFGKGKGPDLPVVVMASDRVSLPIQGGAIAQNGASPIKDEWQRWNDYGIGLFLEGVDKGAQKGELLQAEEVFRKVADLGRADGWVNLGRVFVRQGENAKAIEVLKKASEHKEAAAPWVIDWLTGQINDANGFLDDSIKNYEAVLATRIPDRGFDFSGDYEVINALSRALYRRGRIEPRNTPARAKFTARAIASYRRTLAIDSENVEAHYGLGLAYNEFARVEAASDKGDAATGKEKVAPERLVELTTEAIDPKRDEAGRQAAARALARAIESFARGSRPEFGSRLETLHEVVERLGGAWDGEEHPQSRSAQAVALEAAHKTLHALLKPDETAEGRAVRLARDGNPAADQNAQNVVIHSLHRPGAPGLETVGRSTASTSRREASE
jgi:tetratricopeptide (TPR) repeat protein